MQPLPAAWSGGFPEMSEGLAWTAIGLAAATVFALRYAGFWVMERVGMTPTIERFLEKLSISVLVAIVASAVSAGGARELCAVVAGMVAMAVTKSALLAMSVAMCVAALWTLAFA